MKYPKCPSCGNELLDRTDQCPFCGRDLTRRSFQSIGGPAKHRSKIIALVASMILISGAGFVFLMVLQSEKTGTTVTEKVSEQAIPQDMNAQLCFDNMYRILDAEDEYMNQYGRFADSIDELAEFDSTLDSVCPESGQPYSIVNMKQSVHVRCSVHGEI